MAAEAEQNAADFLASGGDSGGQNFSIATAVAERDRLAVQWTRVLAPQCIASGISAPPVAGAKRAAVWCWQPAQPRPLLLCAPRTSTGDDQFCAITKPPTASTKIPITLLSS